VGFDLVGIAKHRGNPRRTDRITLAVAGKHTKPDHLIKDRPECFRERMSAKP
jgi:hypothetical protein